VADDATGARFLKKRSFSIAGHRTSVALEPEFWAVLEHQANQTRQSLSALVAAIDAGRGRRPLASALRLAALSAVPSVR
jgi:predicted DNA-binding ribbon-helix-helix protein